MRAILAMTALAAALALPAAAEEYTADTSLADNDRIVRSVNVEDLKAIVVAEGHTIDGTGSYGDVSVRAISDDGLIFHLIGTACGTEYSDDWIVSQQVV